MAKLSRKEQRLRRHARVRKYISGNAELRQEMIQRSGQRTVPQIWIAGRHVGGCDDLYALERQGQLDNLLAI